MKAYRTILALFLILALLLPGCGRKLDPDTRALAEACDAVCTGKVVSWEMIPYPEGTNFDLYCAERPDGTRWAMLVKLRLMADFYGNLTPKGTGLGAYSYWYIFVLADADWQRRPIPPYGKPERILFLDIVPGLTHWDSYLNAEDDYLVFAPHSAESMRWRTDDGEGIRFIEALRAYGKRNSRELIPHAAQ